MCRLANATMGFEICSRPWLFIAVIACLSGIVFGEAISRMTGPEIEHALDVSFPFVPASEY